MTAKDPAGPWSDPIILTDTSIWSIDPSLFFDDDGSCYFLANRMHQKQEPYKGYREIALQLLNIDKMELYGDITVLGSGAVKGATTAEAPHIKKKDDYYYLFIAEGGTGINHAVTVSRSKDIRGPYIQCPYNPILTHRQLQQYIDIRNVGHADIIQTQTGEWWLVCLATRYNNGISLMGRETFLAPVVWHEGAFPIVNPDSGYLPIQGKMPAIATQANTSHRQFIDFFTDSNLNPAWTFLRKKPDFLTLTTDTGIVINLQPHQINERTSPSVLLKRVENPNFNVSTKLSFHPIEREEAGLLLIMNNTQNIRLSITEKHFLVAAYNRGEEAVLSKEKRYCRNTDIYLKINCVENKLSFYYSYDNAQWKSIVNSISADLLASREFTGLFAGLYASSNGNPMKNTMKAYWFLYEDFE